MKMKIYEQGSCIMDDFNKFSSGTCGYRISGTCVQRMLPTGEWIDSANVGKPITTLVRDTSGTIHAVCEDGSVHHGGVLGVDPRKNLQARDFETSETPKPGKSSKSSSKGGKKKTPLWKYPFKAIWWFLKFLLFASIFNEADTKKN